MQAGTKHWSIRGVPETPNIEVATTYRNGIRAENRIGRTNCIAWTLKVSRTALRIRDNGGEPTVRLCPRRDPGQHTQPCRARQHLIIGTIFTVISEYVQVPRWSNSKEEKDGRISMVMMCLYAAPWCYCSYRIPGTILYCRHRILPAILNLCIISFTSLPSSPVLFLPFLPLYWFHFCRVFLSIDDVIGVTHRAFVQTVCVHVWLLHVRPSIFHWLIDWLIVDRFPHMCNVCIDLVRIYY